MLSVGRPTDLYFTYEQGKYIYRSPINLKEPYVHVCSVFVFMYGCVLSKVCSCVYMHVYFYKKLLTL